MAITVTLSKEQVREIKLAFRRYRGELYEQIKEIDKRYGTMLRAAAQSEAPTGGTRTREEERAVAQSRKERAAAAGRKTARRGPLRPSIRKRSQRRRGFSVIVYTSTYYAPFIELGTASTGWGKGIKPHRFLRDPADRLRPQFERDIYKALFAAADKARRN